ncbi:hypothetical protein D3C80_1853070 [compost metagenome]
MAAGVHHAGLLRTERHAGGFFNRQGIDVTAQRHHRSGLRADFCNDAGFQAK